MVRKTKNKNEKETPKFDKAKAMAAAMKGFKKKYGDSVISGEKSKEELRDFLMKVDVIPTGSLSLDSALGVWGFPRGRVVELYGTEHSGKTSIALQCIGMAQKMGGTAVFIDVEHALDPLFAMKNGADYSKMIHVKPKSGDDAMNNLDYWLKANLEADEPLVDVIVIDSVAALVTEGQIKKDIGGVDVAVGARLLSQTMRKITPFLGKTVVIFINQIREKVGVMFGETETTPGGKALKFYSSIRCAVSKKEALYLMEDGTVEGFKDSSKKRLREVGRRVVVKITKNKVAPKGFKAMFDYVEGSGIDRVREIASLALDFGIVEQQGAYYILPTQTNKLNGFRQYLASLKAQPEIQNLIMAKIKQIVFENRQNEVNKELEKMNNTDNFFYLWDKTAIEIFDKETEAPPEILDNDLKVDTGKKNDEEKVNNKLVLRR